MAIKDLTVGKPFKLILFFAFPIFLGNLFQQFYNLADALIVGRTLGIDALAAIGATAPLIFLIISFIFASTQGFCAVTAQRFGAGDFEQVRKSVCASFILSFVLMVVLTLISTPFAYKMLEMLKTPQNIINLSSNYLVIMFGGIFATVFYNVSSNVIRALGDSKTPLYFLIFASFLNIFLDILFILKFHLGIKGAGYATVLSQGISTVFCMTFMFLKFPILKLKSSDWKIDGNFLFEHLRIGIPMGFQMSVLTIGVIALQYVLNGFGSNAVAAFTTAMRIDQAFSQAFLALGAAMAVFSAQNFGAGKMSRIKEGARASVYMILVISLFSIFILGFFSNQLTALFMDEPNAEVIKLSAQYLHIIMLFFVFLGLIIVFRNILQGIGKVSAPLISGVAELIARVFCAFILGRYFGYTGICFATPLAWFAGAIVLYAGYKLSLLKHLKQLKRK